MAVALVNRLTSLRSKVVLNYWLKGSSVSWLKDSVFVSRDRTYSVSNRLHLSPLFPEDNVDWLKDCKIDVIDDEMWRRSTGLVDACRGNVSNMKPVSRECVNYGDGDLEVGSVVANKEEPDYDDIEDLRIRRSLFYKIDKDSKEYEEYAYDFHRRKSPKNEKNRKDVKDTKKDNQTRSLGSRVEKAAEHVNQRENKKIKNSKKFEAHRVDTSMRQSQDEDIIPELHARRDSCIEKKQRTLNYNPCIEKKQRTPTYNQLTDAYHEPFCLDIYISTGSVRASVIHRATSKVVVVADSISKDMKFDLSSTKNRNACAAVGEVLAHRALADDIHNLVYTPRKGDKLEGKLQIMLKSIMDGGVNVKVKLKQKNKRKSIYFPVKTQK